MKYPDDCVEEEFIKTKLMFQEKYIELIEAEIFKLLGENESDSVKKECDCFNSTSLILKIKFDAVYKICELLNRKISILSGLINVPS